KAFSEDIEKRFEAYGWDYKKVEDGNDLEAISRTIDAAKEVTDKPTIIEVRTEIGFGAPNAGTAAVHGAPLGAKDVEVTKESYGWEHEPFEVPEEVYARFEETIAKNGAKAEKNWKRLVEEYEKDYPELGEAFKAIIVGELPENWEENLPSYEATENGPATRETSGEVINAIAEVVPNF